MLESRISTGICFRMLDRLIEASEMKVKMMTSPLTCDVHKVSSEIFIKGIVRSRALWNNIRLAEPYIPTVVARIASYTFAVLLHNIQKSPRAHDYVCTPLFYIPPWKVSRQTRINH